MMYLYLVQHGEAVDKETNPDRPLSDKGRNDVQRMAEFVAGAFRVPMVWHSGKTRAFQTAEILAPRLGKEVEIQEHSGLGPMDDVAPIADEINGRANDLMIVGHLPFLGRLAASHITGAEEPEPVAFHMGGVVCLKRGDAYRWQCHWNVVPFLLEP